MLSSSRRPTALSVMKTNVPPRTRRARRDRCRSTRPCCRRRRAPRAAAGAPPQRRIPDRESIEKVGATANILYRTCSDSGGARGAHVASADSTVILAHSDRADASSGARDRDARRAVRQARRRDPVRFGGNKIRKLRIVAAAGAARGRRHADHVRRRPVESRARDRCICRTPWPSRGARRERLAPRQTDGQRAARSVARRRGALRAFPRRARSGDAGHRRPPSRGRPKAVRHSAGRIDAASGPRRTPLAVAELLSQIEPPHHRPFHLVWRNAGGSRCRLSPGRHRHARRRHQRR